MTISIRTRRDVVVVEPGRFLTAARQALREQNPAMTDVEAAAAVVDVDDAVHALLDRDGNLAVDAMDGETIGVGGRPPGVRVGDRPDGLSRPVQALAPHCAHPPLGVGISLAAPVAES